MKLFSEKQNTKVDELVNTAYQAKFLDRFLLLIILLVLAQTVFFLINGTLVLAVFNSLVLGGLWFSLWILRHYSYHLASSLVILLSLSIVLSSILTMGLGNTTIFWFFIFPIIATFLKGKRGGSIWLLILVLILLSLFMAIEMEYIETFAISYDATTFQQLIVGVSLVALFIYFYQDSLDQKASLLQEREEKLSEIYTKLQDEIRRRETISESLKHNLEVLKRKKARDVALLQSIGEGVIAVDDSGQIIFINPVVERMFNLYEVDVVGKKYSQVFNLYDEQGQVIPTKEMPLQKTLNDQSLHREDSLYYHNYNNQPVPVAITANPVFRGGEYIGVVEVFRDISEERAIARAKDEFVSLASHQLRTPLSAIKWYSERLIKTSKLKPKEKKYLKTIHEDSAKMTGLLNDYLNISKLELQNLELNLKEVSPEDIVDETLNDLDPIIKHKELRIVKKSRKQLSLHTDVKLLTMIIQNLLSNAVKYSKDKGQVTISLSRYSGNKESLENGMVLTVEDQGIGIPEKEQSKLFTKLFRAKNAVTSDVEGTGLGLYAVKSAINRLGGYVWFDSKPGKGSQFSVTVPDITGDNDIITQNQEKEDGEKENTNS